MMFILYLGVNVTDNDGNKCKNEHLQETLGIIEDYFNSDIVYIRQGYLHNPVSHRQIEQK